MPFKSRQQQKFLFSQHPGIARRWVNEEKAAAARENRSPQFIHKGKGYFLTGYRRGNAIRTARTGVKRDLKWSRDMANRGNKGYAEGVLEDEELLAGLGRKEAWNNLRDAPRSIRAGYLAGEYGVPAAKVGGVAAVGAGGYAAGSRRQSRRSPQLVHKGDFRTAYLMGSAYRTGRTGTKANLRWVRAMRNRMEGYDEGVPEVERLYADMKRRKIWRDLSGAPGVVRAGYLAGEYGVPAAKAGGAAAVAGGYVTNSRRREARSPVRKQSSWGGASAVFDGGEPPRRMEEIAKSSKGNFTPEEDRQRRLGAYMALTGVAGAGAGGLGVREAWKDTKAVRAEAKAAGRALPRFYTASSGRTKGLLALGGAGLYGSRRIHRYASSTANQPWA